MYIPRKLSVTDELYITQYKGVRLIVSLDGQDQSKVFDYNMDEGTLTRYKTDNDGKPIVMNDEFEKETLYGVVNVRIN